MLAKLIFISVLLYNSIVYAQNFYSSSDVILYTSGKLFQNTNGSVKISISENGISVNGNSEYFNIGVTVLNTTSAIITGQSLRNADGKISMRLNSSSGCITQDGESYCTVVTPSNSVKPANDANTFVWENNPTRDLNDFVGKMPFSIHEKFRDDRQVNLSTLTFEPNGTAKYTAYGAVEKGEITWKVVNNKIDIYKNGQIFMQQCTVKYNSVGTIGLSIKTKDRNYSMFEN